MTTITKISKLKFSKRIKKLTSLVDLETTVVRHCFYCAGNTYLNIKVEYI